MAYVVIEGPAIGGEARRNMAQALTQAVARGFNQEPEEVVVVFKDVGTMTVVHSAVHGDIATEITIEGGRIFPGSRERLVKEATEAATQGFGITPEQVLVLVKGKGGAHMDNTPEAVGWGGATLAERLEAAPGGNA